MVALKLSSAEKKKLKSLAQAKGLSPEKAMRYAIDEAYKRMDLESQSQQFRGGLSSEEAEAIAVAAVRAVRRGHD